MSTFAGPERPYWLSENGVKSVSFNKQAAPPLAYFDKGIMYELNDGNLYYNGTRLNGGGGGDVSGPGVSTVDSFALFDDTVGTTLKSTTQRLRDQGTYGLRITGDNAGFETTLVYADDVNVGLGVDVFGSSLTTGLENVAIGNDCMTAITTAEGNTAVGRAALNGIVDGLFNVAIGNRAMQNSQTAESNIAIGAYALRQCDNVCNIGIGYETGSSLTSGDRNTAVGHSALLSCATGSKNTVYGSESLQGLTSGNRNVAVGSECLQTLETGSDNVCVGRNCGNAYVGAETGNILIGNNVPGEAAESNRIRIGGAQPAIYLSNRHLMNDTTGNMLLGGYSLTPPTGTNNVCVGKNSLIAAAGNFVNSNCVLGQASLSSLSGGDNNVCVGDASLRFLLSGNNNVVVGRNSGNNYTAAESNNILIGGSISGNAAESNVIRIGSTQTRAFVAGIRGVTTGAADAIPVLVDSNGQLGTVSSSIKYKENVERLTDSEVLYELDPVEFNYIGQSKRVIGLIAEEVEQVYPEMCVYDTDGSLLTVDYNRLSILLLSEVKKLKELIMKK
jgi:hypothetical protein